MGEDVLDPLLVERPLQDPMLTSHQQCWPYRADRNFGRLLTTSNTQLAECQVEPSDSCRPMMQIPDFMHCDSVLLVFVCSCISLFDGLNDPFADMTSHDVLYGSINLISLSLHFNV